MPHVFKTIIENAKRKNNMKYLLTKMVFAILFVSACDFTIAYADINCNGNNYTFSQAYRIPVNEIIHATTAQKSDEYYLFEIPSSGYINIQVHFSKVLVNHISIYDMSENRIYYKETKGENTYASDTLNTNKIGMSKGKYYLSVGSRYGDPYFEAYNYSLKIVFTPNDQYESQLNNDFSSADPILLNKTYYARSELDYRRNLYDGDYDYFIFSNPKDQYLTIKATHAANIRNQGIYLYDSNKNEIYSYNFYMEQSMFNTNILLSKGTYYLMFRIDTNLYNYVDYSFSVNTSLLKNQKKVQKIVVSTKKYTIKYKTLKKKKITIKRNKIISISGAKGELSWKKKSGTDNISVDKNGNITVKKKTKKGSYTVYLKLKASGNSSYNAATKTVKIIISIK